MASGTAARFAPYHKWDRNFFLILVMLIWVGIVMGFGGEIVEHIQKHEPAYSLIVHFHAAAFVGWLVLLTVQILLIRRQRHDLHMQLGIAAMVLAAIMIVIGPATAIVVQRAQFGTPDSDPAFFAIQFLDIVAFAGLVIAAFLQRGNSPAHKRLMLLATLMISDAGFARWLGGPLHGVFGDSLLPYMPNLYLANDLLILGLGAYDLITRRRLHPAYIAGVLWIAANQLTVGYLYHAPWWKVFTTHLIGH
jgi:cation transporter-like permease